MSDAQPVLDTADDDDRDALFLATMVGAPTSVHQRTEMEDRLESLLSRGRELANTLVRPEENIDDMGIVAATEALRGAYLVVGSRVTWQTDCASTLSSVPMAVSSSRSTVSRGANSKDSSLIKSSEVLQEDDGA